MIQEPAVSICFTWGNRTQSLRILESTRCFLESEQPVLQNVAQSAREALERPIDFPPLHLAMVPGDRVAIPVSPSIPQIHEVLLGIKSYLAVVDHQPSKVAVILDESESNQQPNLEKLLKPWEVRVHHPHHSKDCAYIAASAESDPIYVNRELAEADLVLPCILIRDEQAYQPNGVLGIVPSFVDASTKSRFERSSLSNRKARNHGLRIADQVGDALGIQVVFAVVPSPDGRISDVIVGTPQACATEGRKQFVQAIPAVESLGYELVVAVIDGDDSQQTWQNVVRACAAAERWVADNGAIAIASRVVTRPSQILPRESAETDSSNDSSLAILPTIESRNPEIARIRDKASLYLLSQLDRESVEALGFAFVPSWSEIEHLIRRHARAVILGGAQFR